MNAYALFPLTSTIVYRYADAEQARAHQAQDADGGRNIVVSGVEDLQGLTVLQLKRLAYNATGHGIGNATKAVLAEKVWGLLEASDRVHTYTPEPEGTGEPESAPPTREQAGVQPPEKEPEVAATKQARKQGTKGTKQARKPGVKQLIRAALLQGKRVKVEDYPGVQPVTVLTMVSDLRSPKYCGPGGPLQILRDKATNEFYMEELPEDAANPEN